MKGILFDLDGVLCATDRYHYLAWKETMATLGAEIPASAMDLVRGVERLQSLELLLREAGISLPAEEKLRLAEEKNGRYKALLNEMSPRDLDPSVAESLVRLRKRGYLLAVGSSSKNAKTVLSRLGLGDFFDAVSDGNGLTRPKPHPEVFLRAAEMLALPPSACAVVEDARAGIEAAKRGGFTAIGMGDAASDPRADYTIATIAELCAVTDAIDGGRYAKHS